MKRSFAAAAVAFLGLASLPARAEEFAVIASSVPAVPAGATVSSGASLDIPAKGRIVLVAASGQVVALKGPYHGPPTSSKRSAGPPEGDVVTIFSALVGSGEQRQTAGVVRGVVHTGDAPWRQAAAKAPADVLAIDATNGGDVCLYDVNRAELIHDPAHSGPMSIEAMNGGAKATVDWPAHATRAPWPKTLPLADGENFLFQQSDDNAAAVATIHVLPESGAESNVARAVQVAKAGCRDQAKLLVALIAKDAR
jgi:hypothetical protein